MTSYRLFIIGIITILTLSTALPTHAAEGLLSHPSPHSVDLTLDRFEEAVTKRGLMVFARLDHAAAAKSVDLTMPRATVIVFGNPRLGTPNFLKTPTLAIDLPLKALVWEDANGQVFLSYNSAEYVYGTLFTRHGIPENTAGLEKFKKALKAMADETLK